MHAIDLPGHGADKTSRRDITADTYKDFVINYVQNHNLNNIIAVGHSMAVVVLSLIAASLRDRIKHLVFFAAVVSKMVSH